MTVPSTARRAGPFLGNGSTTTFSFAFKTFAAGDLQVVKTSTIGVESVLVLASDYTVSLNPDQDASPGGTITYPVSGAPLATGEKLTVLSQLAYEQTTDLLGGGAFNARVIEDTFDRTVIQIQQLEERLDRCVVIPASTSASAVLPTPEPLQVLGWNAAGNALTNLNVDDFLTVAGSSGFSIQTFSGTGAQTAFTLSQNPGAIGNLEVFISGVRQAPTTDYTVSGTTLTFSSAPPAGTSNVFVRWGTTLGIGVPADGAVTFAKLQNVATARLLGRTTAGAGSVEELTAGAGLALSGGALAATSATDTAQGIVELATAAELQTGTDTTRVITPATARAGALVLGSMQGPLSGGTQVPFTGIPSWVRRIKILLLGVSTSGTNGVFVQLGTGGGSYVTTGYVVGASFAGGSGPPAQFEAPSAGFPLDVPATKVAAYLRSGIVTLEKISPSQNWWVCSSNIYPSGGGGVVVSSAGHLNTLAGALDSLRMTTNSLDIFDAGYVNIMYE